MADEINRASPRTQSALLQAMQEYHVSVAGKRLDLPPSVHVLATQNPLEQEGTYPLPEAQLDRFLMQVDVPYPELAAERQILLETTGVAERTAGRVIDANRLRRNPEPHPEMPVGETVVERSSTSCAPPVRATATRSPTATSPGGPARAQARR